MGKASKKVNDQKKKSSNQSSSAVSENSNLSKKESKKVFSHMKVYKAIDANAPHPIVYGGGKLTISIVSYSEKSMMAKNFFGKKVEKDVAYYTCNCVWKSKIEHVEEAEWNFEKRYSQLRDFHKSLSASWPVNNHGGLPP